MGGLNFLIPRTRHVVSFRLMRTAIGGRRDSVCRMWTSRLSTSTECYCLISLAHCESTLGLRIGASESNTIIVFDTVFDCVTGRAIT